MVHRSRRIIARLAEMASWWERYPDIWIREQAALKASGYVWDQDPASLSAGKMVLRILAPQPDGVPLSVEFPASYPYFPPHVTAGVLVASRHQHPFGRNFCLLGRDSAEWEPGNDTLAGILDSQLPKILKVDAKFECDTDFVAANEDHVGEPLSLYLPYRLDSCVIVPDDTPPQLQHAGKLVLWSRPTPDSWGKVSFVATVEKIENMYGKTVVDGLKKLDGFTQSVPGFWMRLASRPEERDVTKLLQILVHELTKANSDFHKAILRARKGDVLVAGFVYPDEIRWRKFGDDWIFLTVEVTQKAKRSRPMSYQIQPVRAEWGGDKAWMQRAPFLQRLRDKNVLIIGLGSLGSPVALQLARAGVKNIDLVDHDHFQVGNTVRWALGWQYAGLSKARALASYIQQEYPHTEATPYVLRIGAPQLPDGRSDDDIIRQLMDRADLVVDASAEFRVNHYLADLCSELGKAYLWLTTTHGAAGGVVGRIVPGRTKGCWHCFQHSLGDKSIRLPAMVNVRDIQTAGCSAPTFVGAGADSDAIPVLAARLAIATLCMDEADSYPDFIWDVAVGDTYGGTVPIAPVWSSYVLEKNEACQACKPK